MQRGRPRHDDVLTPREWEVLDLIREGLTNEQIAERLDVSLSTAKFHVSEIMGKLGAESRQAAAAWPGRPSRLIGLFAWPLPWRMLRNQTPKTVATAAIVASLLALALLALGVALMNARSNDQEVRVPARPNWPRPCSKLTSSSSGRSRCRPNEKRAVSVARRA